MKTEQNFKGFSKEAFSFLNQLKMNNNKEWFEQNRHDYESFLLSPLRTMVTDLSKTMLEIDPLFEVKPAINKTISKIFRDTRFSRNKSPFKTCMWIVFKRPKKNWQDAPGYFFEILPGFYRFGMGFYCSLPGSMGQFREAINTNPKEFSTAISFYSKQKMFALEGEEYKRIIDKTKSLEIQEWYQKKNFCLICNRKIDKNLFDGKIIEDLISGFKMLSPFYNYLWYIREL